MARDRGGAQTSLPTARDGSCSASSREIPAAILVVAEIVVLFAGVLARYVFQAPLVWSDELASILFLWLAMLGSVIALQRGEHMRLTAVVARLSPGGAARAPRRSPSPPSRRSC